jgi:two-component system sensor histidine kinase KdpD
MNAAVGAGARRAVIRTWLLAALALAAVTVGMLAVRASLDKAHVALVYLLIVLGGSAVGGRMLGLTLAGSAFLLFNYLFLPPYHTLVIANPLDWLVLVAFLVTSVVAAHLLTRAQERAVAAERHAAEVARLAALGAETLNAARAEDALGAIADVIRSTLDVDRCELYVPTRSAMPEAIVGAADGASVSVRRLAVAVRSVDASDPRATSASVPSAAGRDGLVTWVAEHGYAAAERLDGTSRIASRISPRGREAALPSGTGASSADAVAGLEAWQEAADTRALAVPLQVRGRTVGVLRLASAAGLTLRPEQREFLSALAYYAALGVDRVRLAADAERVEALREADRLKNAFLANVSHDLRTPLTAIKAVANAITSSGDARATAIEEEADRLNAFVADLLDMSRLSAGALPVRLELNTAEELIGVTRERVRGILGERALVVSSEPAGEVLVGRFDLVHAVHVLVNLIENAHKYAPPGPPIELTVMRAGDVLRLVVADCGPGIPDSERERVFEPFYRGPGSRPDAGGAGLGLSIARGLAEAQGGALRYEPRPGGGSLFTLDLPAADVPPAFDAANPPGASAPHA